MRPRIRRAVTLLAAFSLVIADRPLGAQTGSAIVAHSYGRSVVAVETARAQPGGVLGVTVRNGRWSSANTLLGGRRGELNTQTGGLFGIVPIALDSPPGGHKLSIYFAGARGGATSLIIPVAPPSRPTRTRALSPESVAAASSQTGLGHGRFLLGVIRTRDQQQYHSGPLRPPVDQPIAFPFGGLEDFGAVMGPLKDGLIGEQHRGVDYDVPPGTPVKAPGSGVVLLARSLMFSGETVVIGHGRGLVSVLSHLSYVSAREGELVIQGSPLGTSGRTGLGALTPHLCFSVYLHSLNVDPEALMDGSLWVSGR